MGNVDSRLPALSWKGTIPSWCRRLVQLAMGGIAVLPWLSASALAIAPSPRGVVPVGSGDDIVAAELLVDATSVAPGGRVRIGVHFSLDPGWHLYWRNPGDAGRPPELAWHAPEAEIGTVQWPAPRVFRESDGLLTTFGYEDDVLLASDAVVSRRTGDTWRLEVDTGFVACKVECVPGRIQLVKEVPVGLSTTPPAPEVRKRFERAESRLPKSPESLGIRIKARASQAEAGPGDDFALVLEVLSCLDSEPGSDADCRPWTLDASDAPGAFFPRVKSDLGFSALGLSHPPKTTTESARGFSLALGAHAYEEVPRLDQQRLRGVVPVSGSRGKTHLAVDVPISVAKSADPGAFEVVVALPSEPASLRSRIDAASPIGFASPSLAWALLLGLIGGVILNLMPCVLPVLAIKVFGIADLARADRRHVRQHSLAYLAGVLVSMTALATVVVTLRAAGTAVGWGFQLQDPTFLAAISTVLVIFAMNLFGAFEILVQPSGPGLPQNPGPAPPARSFFEGSLAVALATPCTAPFIGTAVGFAFANSGPVIFAVFTAIGIGLAAPYVLVTLVPAWARLIPRPGAWMLRVRQVLGFFLLGTVVWLVWVAGRALGVDAQTLLLAHLVGIALLLWIYGILQGSGRSGLARAMGVVIVAFAVASLTALPRLPAPRDSSLVSEPSPDGIDWLTFDPSAIDRERAAGRPVFVDFTADWCITCKVNETVVLSDETILDELTRWQFATFKADWTQRDDAITQALAQWGRAGVPMYLVYPADPTQPPQLLPELLTLGSTVDALRAAGQAGGA
ncbi:thioredoxin family protein [Myxococcota bacterium]|nr:thioredoxin family protein [Myxococcota bacterium]